MTKKMERGAALPGGAAAPLGISEKGPSVVEWGIKRPQRRRSTISFLISAIAFAGFRCLGQVWVQFMIVWQR